MGPKNSTSKISLSNSNFVIRDCQTCGKNGPHKCLVEFGKTTFICINCENASKFFHQNSTNIRGEEVSGSSSSPTFSIKKLKIQEEF